MNFADLIHQQVGNAFNNILAPGGLTDTVTFFYFVSAGEYDPENDTVNPVYDEVKDVIVVAAKPTFADVESYEVLMSDTKLVVPGNSLPRDLEVETDKVRYAGADWHVRKTVGVPGRGAFIVFIHRT